MSAYQLFTSCGSPLGSPARTQPAERDPLRVGLVQMRWHADQGEHDDRLREGVRLAAAEGATTVCLPELTRSPYFCNTDDPMADGAARYLEDVESGPTVALVAELATGLGITVHASLYERAEDGGLGYNTAVCVNDDRPDPQEPHPGRRGGDAASGGCRGCGPVPLSRPSRIGRDKAPSRGTVRDSALWVVTARRSEAGATGRSHRRAEWWGAGQARRPEAGAAGPMPAKRCEDGVEERTFAPPGGVVGAGKPGEAGTATGGDENLGAVSLRSRDGPRNPLPPHWLTRPSRSSSCPHRAPPLIRVRGSGSAPGA
ncbi:nitrilase-related carbon-nitrogen hydrolase [Streptomyces goshikiensis]|uniref:nitrilase-related carbon-nitrogen hydrolase n=1 Tax=Streptomyces goshikiensis TaxID=1942 RepID=UPI0036B3FEEA